MKTRYFGVDLHSNQITIHLIKKDENGNVEREQEKIYINEVTEKFLPKLTTDSYVCIEASGMTFSFAHLIKPLVKKVVIINPMDFKALYCSGKKTDKIDAKLLANRLKYYIEAKDENEDFPEVYLPDIDAIELRGLFSVYRLYTENIASYKNRIHSIIKSNLIVYNKDTLFTHIEMILNSHNFSKVDLFNIRLILSDIEKLEESKKEIIKEILKKSYERYMEEIKLIISIIGISDFGASAIMSDLIDIKRFKNAKKLARYLRSAPKIDSSNKEVHLGRTDKKGRKLSFSMILQGLVHLVKKSEAIRNFYERKTKGKSKCKVRTAIVRKTIVAIYYMLKNKELYRGYNEASYDRKLKQIERNKKIFLKVA